jgi:hypothetical protein
MFQTADFDALDPLGRATVTNLAMQISPLNDGDFEVEFWNTSAGAPVALSRTTASNNVLRVAVPPFARDMAFKVRRPR